MAWHLFRSSYVPVPARAARKMWQSAVLTAPGSAGVNGLPRGHRGLHAALRLSVAVELVAGK